MNFKLISQLIGILTSAYSFTMLIPALVGLYYQDNNSTSFFITFLITLFSGLLLWFSSRHTSNNDLSHRDGFLITSLFWIVLCGFSTLPFILSNGIQMNISDSIFEAVSGLTSTGGTAIPDLDHLPKSLLYYRQQIQWFGGIGIIVITVAILPILGIGGMQLYRTEIPGPNKDQKLTPRITHTAKWIFFIYTGLTVLCALAYWAAGMTLFDAIGHSFSTISNGGFSTHNTSMDFYQSSTILHISSFFMLISAVNFTLHYYSLSQKRFDHYWNDPEARFFFLLVIGCSLITFIGLEVHQVYGDELISAEAHAVYQVISIMTTTGFSSTSFANWPSFLPVWIILLACIGGCAGSAAGGIKVIRTMIIFKQGTNELFMLVHPNAVAPIKLKNRRVPDRVVSAIWSFIAIYFYVFTFFLVTLMVTGLDFITAFSAIVACLNNLGVGIGGIASHYHDINEPAKWLLCAAMLLGRLEIFTLLVLFTREFWKK